MGSGCAKLTVKETGGYDINASVKETGGYDMNAVVKETGGYDMNASVKETGGYDMNAVVESILDVSAAPAADVSPHCSRIDKKCEEYVQKLIEEAGADESDRAALEACLCDLPGTEVTYDFDLSAISNNNLPMDNVDATTIKSSGDSADDLGMNAKRVKWPQKRRNEVDYQIPDDVYTKSTEVTMKLEGAKREVYAMSDLHIGGAWSKGMEPKLNAYLLGLRERAKENIAALVLLGDVYEMWLERFHEVPPTNKERVQMWRECCNSFIENIIALVDECQVKVFYIRGNHDREICENDVEQLFDGRVQFIPCTLILRLQTPNVAEQRVRFSHGHEWDVFNSYVLCQSNHLLRDKPIGYYIARAVATAGRGAFGSELEDMLIGLTRGLLSAIPKDLEDDLIEVLAKSDSTEKLITRLFRGAFKVDNIEFLMSSKCRVSEEEYIRLQTLVRYPLFHLFSSLVGEVDVFHMLKAATGDYKLFLKRSFEDVVVLAHTHIWDLKRYRNFAGNSLVYANTGCWTNNARHFSTVILQSPTAQDDGEIIIDHGEND